MANRVPTLLATAVAAACSLSAHANGPTQADFAKVVLYSNVTIAQDSASQWGIWEELEAPAAGPQTPLPLLAGSADPYRPVGSVTPITPPVTPPTAAAACAGGTLCGFGVLTHAVYTADMVQPEALSELPMVRMGFTLSAEITQANADSGSWLPQGMLVNIQGVRTDTTDTAPTYTNLGPLTLQNLNTHTYPSTPNNEEMPRDEYIIATDTASSASSSAQAGTFLGTVSIISYVTGEGGVRQPSSQAFTDMYGIWGVTTSAQDMNSLRLSNAQANYSGSVFNQDGSNNGSVLMNVNFGTSQFTANFSNVGNGQVPVGNNAAVPIAGTLTFQASGLISGSQFSANQLSTGVTGKVEGAFFGSQAAVAAGVLDVTATPTSGIPSSPRIATRYAAPFIAIKQSDK